MTCDRNVLDAVLRHDLPSFIAKCFATLEPGAKFQNNWHIDHIAHELSKIACGDTKRLMINIPPRHLKSVCVTIAYTAWYLGHQPSAKIMAVSYGAELAEELASQFLIIVQSEWYQRIFPSVQIRKNSKRHITTTANGARYAVGVGGSILGRGADLIVIDDPMKAQAAYSESERRKVHEFYDHTLSTRLNNKNEGAIILIMQRLHEDDLCGHVLERENWEKTIIPAIAPEDATYKVGPGAEAIYRRRKGEVIQDSREDPATLNNQRRLLGSMNFEAQYQQDPVPAEGLAIKREWLRYYDELPQLGFIMASWDTASTLGQQSDYSVGTVWGFKGSDSYLIDLVRGRFEAPELRRKIEELHRRHEVHETLIENTELGRAIFQEMRRHSSVKPHLYKPRYEKEYRLLQHASRFERGEVIFPRNASWLANYVAELMSFPNGKHDDQVDSTT